MTAKREGKWLAEIPLAIIMALVAGFAGYFYREIDAAKEHRDLVAIAADNQRRISELEKLHPRN